MKQAETVKSLIMAYQPHVSVDLLGITTQADKRLEVTLTDIGGKGLFVKEIEEAFIGWTSRYCRSSMKDVPMELPEGLILPVIGEREDPRDAFISDKYESLSYMPRGASLGTSSLRRQTQVRALRPDITMKVLRGNINTRLKRLDAGEYDAIILAAAPD